MEVKELAKVAYIRKREKKNSSMFFLTVDFGDEDGFQGGAWEVWYMKEWKSHFGVTGFEEPPTPPADLTETHTQVAKVIFNEWKESEEAANEIWIIMQGERWSPQGEAKDLIRSLNLKHTSMCIGDLIKAPSGNLFVAESVGFRRINRIGG